MPRRGKFQWTLANTTILIVLVVLIVLGAMYGVRMAQLAGSQLAAKVPPAQPINDSRCLADSKDEAIGEIVILADPFTPKYPYEKTLDGARKQGLANARAWVKGWNCSTSFATYAGKIQGGKVTKQPKSGITVSDDLKASVGCSIKPNVTDALMCTTACEKIDTKCLNSTQDFSCGVTKDPTGPKGGPFTGLEVTCAVRVKVSAICKCPTPAPTPPTATIGSIPPRPTPPT